MAAGEGAKPLAGRPRGALEDFIAARAVAGKKTDGDDPRGARGGNFSCVSASLPPLPVAVALRLSLLLSVGRVAVALLHLPRSPLTGCHAAGGAAITRQRPAGPEDLLAMLQQTPPTPRTASTTLGREKLSEELLFRRRRRILTGAHGSSLLREAQVSKGNWWFPFEAPCIRGQSSRLGYVIARVRMKRKIS